MGGRGLDLFPIVGTVCFSAVCLRLHLSQAVICGVEKREGELVSTRQKGSNFQDVNGRSRIRSGMASLRTVDSHPSDQSSTLQCKIGPPFSEFTRRHHATIPSKDFYR